MSTSHAMLTALKAFHLDNPEATFEELTEHLRDIAVNALEQPQGDVYGLVLSDLAEGLAEAEHSASLTVPQAKALKLAYRVLKAHRDRVEGNVGTLLDLLDNELATQGPAEAPSTERLSVSQSVNAIPLGHPEGLPHASPEVIATAHDPKDHLKVALSAHAEAPTQTHNEPLSGREGRSQGLTYMALFEAYMLERANDMAPATIKNLTSSAKSVAEILGGVDMKSHTRADMLGLRGTLLETRKPSTVNKVLTNVGSVVSWGVATGMIERDFTKKLTIIKGSDSDRQAFAPGQIKTIKDAVGGYLKGDWKGAALSLGVATGARIGEIHQLCGCDFIQGDDGQWAVSINDDNGKTLKNSYSRRIVPLVGIPEATLKALAGANGRIFKMSMSGFSAQLNTVIRDLLGTSTGEGLSFHSLRHSMASDLKAVSVALGVSQEILGHSSGSITYDLYGKGSGVDLGRLREALELVR